MEAGTFPVVILYVFVCLQVDSVHIDGPTPFNIPDYKNDVVLGLLTSFAYPIFDSGKISHFSLFVEIDLKFQKVIRYNVLY